MDKYKVLFHLDEEEKGRLALNNIQNLINDLGEDNVEIELVANAKGLTIFLKNPGLYSDLVGQLFSKGVRFASCQNTMKQMGLTKDDLLGEVDIVSSGVGELTRKQAQGWGYIRP